MVADIGRMSGRETGRQVVREVKLGKETLRSYLPKRRYEQREGKNSDGVKNGGRYGGKKGESEGSY